MVRAATFLAVRSRVRLILMVMVAIATSMALHHGAMASTPGGLQEAPIEASHHHSTDSCLEGACGTHTHSMPVCCGMGLCLSALPVAPFSGLPKFLASADAAGLTSVVPRWPNTRIDRPPKTYS